MLSLRPVIHPRDSSMSSVDPPVSESLQPPAVVPPLPSHASQLSGFLQEDVDLIAAAVVGLVQPHRGCQQNPLSSSGVSSADLSVASSSTITTVASK